MIASAPVVVAMTMVRRGEKDTDSVLGVEKDKAKGWSLVLGVTGWMGVASYWAKGSSGKRRIGEVKSVLDRLYTKCLLKVWMGILRYYSGIVGNTGNQLGSKIHYNMFVNRRM